MGNPNKELLNEFLVESFENLSAMNEQFTLLEKNPKDDELLNAIYRTMHTLKGSASFLGFNNLMRLSHSAENLLDQLREKKKELRQNMVDALLQAVDACNQILKNIESDGTEGQSDYSHLVERLENDGEAKSMAPALGVQLGSSPQELALSEKSLPIFHKKENENKSVEISFPKKEEQVRAPEFGNSLGNLDSIFSSALAKESTTMVKKEAKENSSESISQAATTPTSSSPASSSVSVPTPANGTVEGGIADSFIRVNVNLLDKIMNVVGELVLNRNQIVMLANSNAGEVPELISLSKQLNSITSQLQEDIMTTRMQPVGVVLNKFERLVRDLARSQKKKVLVSISGKETELDKGLLEAIRDPLTHMVRNAVDHGIEFPEERVKNGKAESGTLSISSYHEGGQVIIEIQDDGKGMDVAKLKKKALEKNLFSPEKINAMTDKEAFNLIFQPGFSTAEKITDISGRGVGMDVVKTNIEKIGGQVDISTVLGKGSTFRLKIPLTLAIVPALTVRGVSETFAIPQSGLLELMRLEEAQTGQQIVKIHQSEFLKLRGELVPLIRLNDVLDLQRASVLAQTLAGKSKEEIDEDEKKRQRNNDLNIVILQAEGTIYGLVVDAIYETIEIVVKPMGAILQRLNFYAGTTIMGDGTVALILDVLGLYKRFTHSESIKQSMQHKTETIIKKNQDMENFEVLLFRLGDGQTYGIPLSLVHRLEEFPLGQIEFTGKRPIIRYRNVPMPLVNIEKLLELEALSVLDDLASKKQIPSEKVFGLVVSFQNQNFSLAVSEIIDIATTESAINTEVIDREGIFGTVLIAGKTITVIDAYQILGRFLGKTIALNGPKEKSEAGQSNKIKGQKILLVDDSPMFRKMNGELLSDMGADVITATDGAEALAQLRAHPEIKLIVSDIEMPNMNGNEFIQEVRRGPFKNIPAIAVTTRQSENDRKKGIESGFNSYLEKFDKNNIIKTLLKLCA